MKKTRPFISSIFAALLLLLGGCATDPITTVESFDGVNIRFDNVGKGEPTIILVHGWSNTRTIWDAQIDHFSQKYRVIAVDLPGFGKSGNNRNEWTMEAFGKDISAIVRQLKLKKVVLVGFSMGAPVVIEAAKNLPEHITGVVLVDDIQEIEMQIPSPMAHFVDSMMMDLVTNPTKEKLIGGGFFKHNIDESTERVIAFLEDASQIGWQESLQGYINWTNESSTQSVQAVKAPIISINSDMQPTNIEAFRKYSPSYKAKIVKDVGHVIMWDNTAEFNRLLEESIQEFMGN